MDTPSSVLDLAYSDRQLIVVTDDAVLEATEKAELAALNDQRTVNWARLGEAAAKVVFGSTGLLLAEVTREALKAWGRARASGLQVRQVGKSQAGHIAFPPGHPREGVLYIGHPAHPNVYYTTAAFHRATFEHKFSEAIRILMHLGATRLRVEHVIGWSSEFKSRLTVPLGDPDGTLGVEGRSGQSSGSQLLYEATLDGRSQPELPKDLAWYPHEPTWHTIADGRMNFGLRTFSLSVAYEDDYRVNAGLKAAVLKAGLELGGSFEDHEATVWKIAGEFSGSKPESA